MRSPLPFTVSIALLLTIPASATPPAEVVSYEAARIWTGDGPPIEDGVLVVSDGRVSAVGSKGEVDVPETARVVDLGTSAVLIPGLVSAETGLGFVRSDDERALTPGVRAIDGFDPFADFDEPLSGGVTTVQLSPGRNRLMPGRGAVVKLDGPDLTSRTLDPEGDLRVLLSPDALNPPRIYEPPPRLVARDRPIDPTQPQLASSLAGAVAGLRSLIEAALDEAEADDPIEGTDPLLDPLADALDATGRLRVTAPGAAEIRAALSLAREFDLRLLLVDPVELSPFLDRLDSWAGRVEGVILDARFRPGQISDLPIPDPDDPEPVEPWDAAADLIDAGLPVAIVPGTDSDLDDLLFLAGQFTAGGLSDEQVLRMITASPAELLGVADRVGTLSPGKDADFVVLSGDPFDLHSRVLEVHVSGRRSWSADSESKAVIIRAGEARIGDGSTVEAPAIVVQDGTIRGVGPDASAPIDAEVFVFEGAVVTPGLLDLATDLGLGGPLSARPSSSSTSIRFGGDDDDDRDSGGPSRTSVSLDTKLGERLVSDDPASAVARRGGITTVLTGPRESSPAPLVAFKLGDEPTVLRDPAAIRFRLGGNLTTAVPGLRATLRRAEQYAESWEKYKRDLAEYEQKKKEYEEARARLEAEKKAEEAKKRAEEARKKAEDAKKESGDDSEEEKTDEGDQPESKDEPPGDQPPKPDGDGDKDEESSDEQKDQEDDDSGDEKESEEADDPDKSKLPEEPKRPEEPRKVDSLEPYRALFGGDIPALVEVDRLDAIQAAVELFRDDFELDTVLLGAEDAFRDVDLLVEKEVAVVVGPTLVREVDRETVNLAQVLATRGVPFGFQSEAGTGSATLPRAVRYAVRLGLGTGDALAGLSASPSNFLGLADRVGTLAPGKDADLVVWSGPPFQPSSRVLAVMIDGTWVYLDQEDER